MSKTEFLIGRSGLDLEDDFYPQDLPSEWRFDYYSTLFKTLSLPIDGHEDLEQIFAELADSDADDEPFELILTIAEADLLSHKKLAEVLSPFNDYQAKFTLFAVINHPPPESILGLLDGHHLCFQSPKPLKIKLKHKQVIGQNIYFNQLPVFYSAMMLDETQIRDYLTQIATINTKTALICKFAESETLLKVRTIAELLGF